MTYEEKENMMFNHLKNALGLLESAMSISDGMCKEYGQDEYGRNEDILEARQAVKSIVEKFGL